MSKKKRMRKMSLTSQANFSEISGNQSVTPQFEKTTSYEFEQCPNFQIAKSRQN